MFTSLAQIIDKYVAFCRMYDFDRNGTMSFEGMLILMQKFLTFISTFMLNTAICILFVYIMILSYGFTDWFCTLLCLRVCGAQQVPSQGENFDPEISIFGSTLPVCLVILVICGCVMSLLCYYQLISLNVQALIFWKCNTSIWGCRFVPSIPTTYM